MNKPQLLDVTATLLCACGEQIDLDAIDDGRQHIQPCDCGRRLSVQIGDPIVQYDGPSPIAEAKAAAGMGS
jgi:hypothetical protein